MSQNWVSARERRGRSDERDERVRKFQRRRFCKPSLFFFRQRKETGVQKRCFFFLSSYLHLHAQREREREGQLELLPLGPAYRGPGRGSRDSAERENLSPPADSVGQRFEATSPSSSLLFLF